MSLEDTEVWQVVLYCVISVLVLFSNSIVVIVIIKSRDLRYPTLWNIAVMAAWDFAFGCYVIVFIVPSKIKNSFAYPDSYGRFLSVLMTFIIAQNSFNIILALTDRYISICWPLHYPRLMSAKRFIIASITLLLINILRCSILLATDGAGSYSKSMGFYTQEKPTFFRTVSRSLTFIITFIIVGLLIRIRVELNKKTTNGNAGGPQTVSTQFTNTMCISNVVYILCYIPSAVALLVGDLMNEEHVLMEQIGFMSIVSNSLWNVIIYAAVYRPFRDAFLKVFCPTYNRERARRELQVQFRRNRASVFTV